MQGDLWRLFNFNGASVREYPRHFLHDDFQKIRNMGSSRIFQNFPDDGDNDIHTFNVYFEDDFFSCWT